MTSLVTARRRFAWHGAASFLPVRFANPFFSRKLFLRPNALVALGTSGRGHTHHRLSRLFLGTRHQVERMAVLGTGQGLSYLQAFQGRNPQLTLELVPKTLDTYLHF